MSVLYITEYADQPVFAGKLIAVGNEPAVAEQHIAITGSSAQSAAFNAKTIFIRIHTDAICSTATGSNPTAATTAHRMAANATEFAGVRPGDKIAVIANT